jgi:DNA-directed RNA polymerase beta' subunit
MKNTTPSLRSYLYEYMFYRAIERTQENIGSTIMVSQARHLRDLVGEKLADQGLSMTDADLKVSPVLRSIEETLRENVPGYKSLFSQTRDNGVPFTTDSKGYAQLSNEFMAMTGLSVSGSTGPAGPRLPISPYDPRWAVRSTVKQAGSSLLNIPDHLIEEIAEGKVGQLAQTRSRDLLLYGTDDNGKAVEAGRAMTVDDISGMTELMNKMSAQEYRDVRQWLVDGGINENGRMDYDRFMSPEALSRSVAILNELGEQGTPYKVLRDRKQGQIRAQIEGTKISVRLTDIRSQEHFVGRVYDDGVVTRYTTNHKVPGSDKTINYTPTAQESVDLLRIAQGRPVQRADGRGFVGAIGSHSEMIWNKAAGKAVSTDVQESYYSSGSAMFVVGDLVVDDSGRPSGSQVMIRRDASQRSAASKFFADSQAAETYLRTALDSARENLRAALGVEELIQAANEHAEDATAGEWFPEFDGNPEIAAIQRGYWDVLRGAQTTLLRPGATEDAYLDKLSSIGELGQDEVSGLSDHDLLVGDLAYVGDAELKVREHSTDTLDALLGSYDLHEVRDAEGNWTRQRFDPVRLAKYMTSEYGTWRNNDDIVGALRTAAIPADELMGDSFYANTIRDRLIKFDEATARQISTIKDPFVRRMAETVRGTIERNGAVVTDLAVDDNGIVKWTAERSKGLKGETETVTGQIGQIFSRGEHGEIVTKFAGGDNYLFVPGYEAGIAVQKPGENKTVEERTVLRGYEQIMTDQIQYKVASDLLGQRTQTGEPTSLNNVYRRLYDVRHEVDFIERSAEEGLSAEWRDAILATEGSRVRYPNTVRDGSTINAEYQADNGRGVSAVDPANDNSLDPWILTGNRNMAIMTEEGNGYFDPVVTSGSINQGVTRYLVEGATVSPEGIITPGAKDDRTALMKHPETSAMRFNPFDRQQMTASNLMQAAAVTPPVKTAMMTFGGWTADDPLVVSQRFAQQHRIRGVDGTMRDLVVGDKLSDLHGNKGVISLVIDPDMNPFEAETEQLTEAVEWFKKNPELDVVMSPFSAVSRFNGGSARELMQNTSDLRSPDGTVHEGSIGEMRFIVTHMAVDAKTRVYDDEALAQGRGRKASSQLAWALGSHGAEKVLAECYGPNSTAVGNFREMLVTMGLDMEPDGTLRIGSDELDENSERRLFEMPELVRTAARKSARGESRAGLNVNQMKRDFGVLIGDKGGDLELPFPLKLPTEHLTPKATDASWKLPVMSSHLRSGQDLDDGSSTVHDYTNHYLTIHEQACRYRFAQEELADNTLTAEQRRKHTETLTEAPRLAQSAFNTITDSLKDKRFTGKHNVFKEQLMASRLPHSATAVWTSDPRLDIDQVAMGPAMAEALGFEEDDHALVWRDPVLRDGGVRYMRVAIDPRLTGVSINPVMDASFDGDFDGDAVAVVRLTSDAAKAEARQKLSVEANLLDLGTRLEDGTYPLAMQNSLDTKVSQHVRPELATRFEELRMRANDVKFDLDEGEITARDAARRNADLTRELSGYYRDALSTQYGDATLSFSDVPTHLKSVMTACVETGAKGSEKKVRDYAHYLGADAETFADLGETQATQEDHEGVMYATAIKSFGTGVAGTFSQRGVKALRNEELKAVLELTYPVTQSVLQAKHDPKEARQKYEMLMGPARALWKGRKLETVSGADGNRRWEAARDESGKELQADTATWKKQFLDLYTSKDGLNVSINDDNVEKVAAALSRNGVMIDMEEAPSASSEAQNLGSTMDRLAYGGSFEDVLAAAANRENVFEGRQNSHFAPYALRKNQQALAAFDEQILNGFEAALPELIPLSKRDVLPEHHTQSKARGGVPRSAAAVTVSAPARRFTPVVPRHAGLPEETSLDAGANDYQL